MRTRRRGTGSLLLLVSGAVAGCDPGGQGTPLPEEGPSERFPFDDVTTSVGLDFHHYPGATGHYYFVEPVGSGVALLDFDSDGDMDVYLVQAGTVPGAAEGVPIIALPEGSARAMAWVSPSETSTTTVTRICS